MIENDLLLDTNSSEEVDLCIMDGKEYLKGQAIPTGDPCKTCECTHGFNGNI